MRRVSQIQDSSLNRSSDRQLRSKRISAPAKKTAEEPAKLHTLWKASLYIRHPPPFALTSTRISPPLLSHAAKERWEVLETRLPGFHTTPHPPTPPLAPAADGLICSLKPRGGGENDFFIILLRRQGEGSPGVMAGRGEETWVECRAGPVEVTRPCFHVCTAVFARFLLNLPLKLSQFLKICSEG